MFNVTNLAANPICVLFVLFAITAGFIGCDTPASGSLESSESSSENMESLSGEPEFSYTGIGVPVDGPEVNAINNEGQVVGTYAAPTVRAVAFLWDGKDMDGSDMNFIGYDVCGFDVCTTEGMDVNDKGQVAGRRGYPFIWDDSTVTDLGDVGGRYAYPLSINEQAQVVGYSVSGARRDHAFLWENGSEVTLCTNSKESRATSINNQGQVVGWRETTEGEWYLFLWEDGKMKDLGIKIYPGRSIMINDKSKIIASRLNNKSILWENGEVTDLGFRAIAINNKGQVLGVMESRGQDDYLIWENGTITEISFNPDIPNVVNEGARFRDLNDSGQLTGVIVAEDPDTDCGYEPSTACSNELAYAFILNKYAE